MLYPYLIVCNDKNQLPVMMIFSIQGAVERNVKSTNTASSDGSKHVLDLARIDGGKRVECSKAERKSSVFLLQLTLTVMKSNLSYAPSFDSSDTVSLFIVSLI